MTLDVERAMHITPADWVPGPGQGNWTYNLYAALPEDGKRYEIVDGVLLDMSPAPGTAHQTVVLSLAAYMLAQIDHTGLGRTFTAPIDVELSPKMVFEPDVVVVLKAGRNKVQKSHIVGAPDLVVEVASPRTKRYDRTIKREAYARAGIREYWLVDPIACTIEVLLLEAGTYRSAGIFKGRDTLRSQVVPTIAEVRVEHFFAEYL
ncbi:MAG TPA: Uma2 family endonuclease [Ktedonobacteraceae bacterium]|nr:Uma2 family endonuclease [Ktedonobacteraceae bacterium]